MANGPITITISRETAGTALSAMYSNYISARAYAEGRCKPEVRVKRQQEADKAMEQWLELQDAIVGEITEEGGSDA